MLVRSNFDGVVFDLVEIVCGKRYVGPMLRCPFILNRNSSRVWYRLFQCSQAIIVSGTCTHNLLGLLHSHGSQAYLHSRDDKSVGIFNVFFCGDLYTGRGYLRRQQVMKLGRVSNNNIVSRRFGLVCGEVEDHDDRRQGSVLRSRVRRFDSTRSGWSNYAKHFPP
jgi:hypothetical protein